MAVTLMMQHSLISLFKHWVRLDIGCMNKRMLLIGAAVAVVGLVLWLLAPGLVPLPFEYSNFTIAAGAFHMSSFAVPAGTSVLLMDVNFSSPVNVYGFAGGAASAWEGSSGSGLDRAEALIGNGLVAAYTNVSAFVIDGSVPGVAYSGNTLYNMTPSTTSAFNYTLVFDNSNNATKPSSAHMEYLGPISASNLSNGSAVSNYLITIGAMEWAFLIMMIAGIGVAIWGALKKPRVNPEEQQAAIEERDRLYKGTPKHGGGKRAKR